jgi:hypothetical protein
MRREPANRYQSAKILAEEIERFQSGAVVEAYRYTRSERLVRFVRRHKRLILGSASIAALLLVLGVFSYLRIREERDIALALLEKLRQQQTDEADSVAGGPVQSLPGVRARVSVLPFAADPSIVLSPEAQAEIGRSMERELAVTGRFAVASSPPPPGDGAGADLQMKGRLNRDGPGLEVVVRVLDARTMSTVVGPVSVTSGNDLFGLCGATLRELAQNIAQSYPLLSGTIVGCDGEEIRIEFERAGAVTGMYACVLDSRGGNAEDTQDHVITDELEIVSVNGEQAIGRISSSETGALGALREGLVIVTK